MPGEGGGFVHSPVLVREVVSWLGPALVSPSASPPAGVLVDCTLGGGGHTLALLDAIPALRAVGMDRDHEAVESAATVLAPFGGRVRLLKVNFADLAEVIEESVGERPAAILYDLGVSSPQIDRPDRGFHYRGDAPLDMRMDRSQALSASEVVNTYPEDRLAGILFRYGEERFARRIARAVVRRRARRPFEGTQDLARVVREAIPAAARRTGPH
ncbi:MAG: 16S rRNA (cytosine(1402)-N(4))-methyltransferase RsmH, partial [Candidatus Methylomirabilales bacterium]